MISLSRPGQGTIVAYHEARLSAVPTCIPGSATSSGFDYDRFSREIGLGDDDFHKARDGLISWAAHSGSGVEVFPAAAEVAAGETVTILTRQIGVWVLAACRVMSVVDQPTKFGFTYATLPDHPECGYESFEVKLDTGTVRFEIEATSKPGIPLVRLGRPLTRVLQKRATHAYLTSLARWVRTPGDRP
jgi:uncharacterized protein (UPF0548 family)